MSDLLALVSADVKLRRAASTDGGEYVGPCPLCRAGRDRFHVWPHSERPRWWCRHCGENGDAIEYLRKVRGLSFAEAKRVADGESSAPQRQSQPAPAATKPERRDWEWAIKAGAVAERCAAELQGSSGARALEFLRKRGITRELAEQYQLGFNASDRPLEGLFVPRGITIPWFRRGVIEHVNVRRASGSPKYRAIAGGHPILFNASAIRDGDTVLLVEGEFDAILLSRYAPAGVVPVATGGAGRRKLEPVALAHLLGTNRVLVAYDSDEGGDSAAMALIQEHPGFRRVRVPDGKDPTDYHTMGGNLASWISDMTEEEICAYCGGPLEAYGVGGAPCCRRHAEGEYRAAAGSHLVHALLEEHGAQLWEDAA